MAANGTEMVHDGADYQDLTQRLRAVLPATQCDLELLSRKVYALDMCIAEMRAAIGALTRRIVELEQRKSIPMG